MLSLDYHCKQISFQFCDFQNRSLALQRGEAAAAAFRGMPFVVDYEKAFMTQQQLTAPSSHFHCI